MTIAKAIARAWTDAAYKTKLVSDPHAALSEAGVSIPTGTTVKVIENTADTAHVVLPAAPAKASEMSADELEKVAGGNSSTGEAGGGEIIVDPVGGANADYPPRHEP